MADLTTVVRTGRTSHLPPGVACAGWHEPEPGTALPVAYRVLPGLGLRLVSYAEGEPAQLWTADAWRAEERAGRGWTTRRRPGTGLPAQAAARGGFAVRRLDTAPRTDA